MKDEYNSNSDAVTATEQAWFTEAEIVKVVVGFIIEGVAGKYTRDQEHAWFENFFKNTATQIVDRIIFAIKENSLIEQTGFLEGLRKRIERAPYENDEYLDRIIDDLLTVTSTLKAHIERDINFGANKVYDTYREAMLLLMSCYNTDINLFKNYESYEFIITHVYNELLEIHNKVEKYLYSYYTQTHDIMKSIDRGDTPKFIEIYRFRIEHDVNIKLRDKYNIRRELERGRYIQLINMNNNFELNSSHEFKFFRCTQNVISSKENNKFLSVNNENGTISPPSVLKDVSGIPENSNIIFDVNLSSEKPERNSEVVIWEIGDGTIINKSPNPNEYFILNNDWKLISRKATKQRENSQLRFEIYWHDNHSPYLNIDNYSIIYSEQEIELPEVYKKEYLPILSLYSWNRRCSNLSINHELSDGYPTSQLLYANDEGRTYSNPSIFHDLDLPKQYGDWSKLNIIFEANIKTEKNVNRKISIAIHELRNINGERFDIVNTSWNEGILLTDKWLKIAHKCDRKTDNLIRIEIYWNDNDPTNIILKDSYVGYYLD